MSSDDPRFDDDPRLDDEPRDGLGEARSGLRLRRLANLLLPVLLVAGGGYVLWDGYREGGVAGVEVPVLRADPSPMRLRPENPGGMEVPFRDRIILRQASLPPPDAADQVALTRPEAPLPRDIDEENGVVAIGDILNRGEEMVVETILARGAEAPELGVSERESDMLDSLIVEMADEPALSLPPLARLSTGAGDDPLAQLIDETAGAAPDPTATDPAAPEPAASEPAAIGGFGVQIATVGDPDDVAVEWQRQARIFRGILDGVGLIEDPDAIRSGSYLRVMLGPLLQSDAQALCQRIRGAGGDCFVRALEEG
ncbi:MAG: hypothetical protein RLO50_03330 [Azospirillaceae bacterium]